MTKMLRALFAVAAGALPALAQTPATPPDPHEWWKHAVFYEIYPRSFADGDGDGVGDLKGITSKLDYLRELGVDAVWITPCFPSPQVDFGYDVSDYEQIDPMYGTLADFDRLVAEGRKRGIRIILDLVVNHTSDQHKWFLDSKASRTAAHRDWYIWRDERGAGPPNNWQSLFGGPAWKLDPATGQYYYHFFYPEQPDLNWRNPAVEKAILDVTRYWYERGVAGFRLDAVDILYEVPELTDNAVVPGTDKFGRPNMDERHNRKLPEVHDALRKLRKVADEHGAVLIGETWTSDIAELKQYYGDHGDELQMPMDFMFTTVNKLSAPEFRKQIAAVDASGGWPVYVIGNHDIVRSYHRYGDGVHDDAIAKVMAALYLTLRGTPILYYGEELGMENNDPKSRDDVKDPIGRLGWPLEKGRDGERTPMQWDASENAGFSKATPWLPVPPSAKTRNVATEAKDPASLLNLYRKLTALRRSNAALREGEYLALAEGDDKVLAYLRRTKDAAVLVALNMSAAPQTLRPELAAHGSKASRSKTLIATHRPAAAALALDSIRLEPFEVVIAELAPER